MIAVLTEAEKPVGHFLISTHTHRFERRADGGWNGPPVIVWAGRVYMFTNRLMDKDTGQVLGVLYESVVTLELQIQDIDFLTRQLSTAIIASDNDRALLLCDQLRERVQRVKTNVRGRIRRARKEAAERYELRAGEDVS